MAEMELPAETIDRYVRERAVWPDAAILEELLALPALADEGDLIWEDDGYWESTAYVFVALCEVAAERKLDGAMRLFLERAAFGDPGEIMRGLRHTLEAIVEPDWCRLADLCLVTARSARLGTRLWSIDALVALEDPRARPVFEAAIASGPAAIASVAEIGLARLSRVGA
ncbi:MAG: hypothetical protein AMXMBFR36_25970 [Acidobacteriota bacterium]